MAATDGDGRAPGAIRLRREWSGVQRRPRHGVSGTSEGNARFRVHGGCPPLRVSGKGGGGSPARLARSPATFFIGSTGGNNGRAEGRQRARRRSGRAERAPRRCRRTRLLRRRRAFHHRHRADGDPCDEACSARGGNPRVPDHARFRPAGARRRGFLEPRSRAG